MRRDATGDSAPSHASILSSAPSHFEETVMTPVQIEHVRMSFALVRPISETAAALFYSRLFELDPSLKPMFKSDLRAQGRLLMQVLGVAVTSLDRLDALTPTIRAMGRRYAGYGVETRHYDTVAEALLWTLEQGLGDAFTPAVRDAWVSVYGVLAHAMQTGAAQERPAAAAA
jgi:hemoglobin-like flavoprotein